MHKREIKKIIRIADKSRYSANFLQRNAQRLSAEQRVIRQVYVKHPLPQGEFLSKPPGGVNNLAHPITDASLSGMQNCISNAYTQMFGKKLTDAFSVTREFSTYSRNSLEIKFPKHGESSSISDNQRQPKSVADLSPPEKVANEFELRKIAHWKRIANNIAGRELTDEEYEHFRSQLKKHARDIIKGSRICKRVDADTFLNAILVDGYFKSSSETGSSVGFHTPDDYASMISRVQNALFDYEDRQIPKKEDPICAFVTRDNYGGRDNGRLIMHGDIAVYFDDDVEQYVSIVGEDSPVIVRGTFDDPCLYARADPFNNPTENIFPLQLIRESPINLSDDPRDPDYLDYNPLVEFKNTDDVPTAYIEAHIHRFFMPDKALPVEAINRVVIRNPEELGPTKTLALIKELNKRGISWDIGKSEEDSQHLQQKFEWIRDAFLSLKLSLFPPSKTLSH